MGLRLHDYQLQAIDFLQNRGRAALMLEMGLGKTAVCLSALRPEDLPALVVAPKRVAEEVWPTETKKWRPDLTCVAASGSTFPRQSSSEPDRDVRARALVAGADITSIGRENLPDVLKVHKRKLPDYKTFIVDELSGYKSRSSARWKGANNLIRRHDFPNVWGLTGTPVPNGLLDLWGQIALLDGGQRLGPNITTYRNRYFIPSGWTAGGIVTEYELRPESEAHIHDLISDICLSMKAAGRINLPDVSFVDQTRALPTKVQRVYREMERELISDLRAIFGEGETHTAQNAAHLTSKLSQINAGFMFEDPIWEPDPTDPDGERFLCVNAGVYSPLHDTKLEQIRELIEGNLGSPILCFYRFVPERDQILAEIPGARSISEPGVLQDWDAGKVPLLLAHPESAGHGLNLQYGGHTIVWVSPTWNLEHWDQGNGRLARQGQTQPVVIHSLMADGTIDTLIRTRLEEKDATQTNLLDFVESPI